MKQLKPRDKVTQHMTRDGLTLDNQTTGESINISSREAEQDYSCLFYTSDAADERSSVDLRGPPIIHTKTCIY